MEMMPYHAELDDDVVPYWAPGSLPAVTQTTGVCTARSDWHREVPVLAGTRLTMRELKVSDAPALLEQLSAEEVSRFISPPPSSVEAFEKFILWTHRERTAGRHVCLAVVPEGHDKPVGMFQVRVLADHPGCAEWGFALGSSFWGTGLFAAGARLVLDFTFEQMGVRRLEARSAVLNGRGNGALRKLGAVCEGVLHESFERYGERLDQALWTIEHEDWLFARVSFNGTVH
jgi:RimJ/RimL family protein N-acetyltransferase